MCHTYSNSLLFSSLQDLLHKSVLLSLLGLPQFFAICDRTILFNFRVPFTSYMNYVFALLSHVLLLLQLSRYNIFLSSNLSVDFNSTPRLPLRRLLQTPSFMAMVKSTIY